jgi:hypothetical protein
MARGVVARAREARKRGKQRWESMRRHLGTCSSLRWSSVPVPAVSGGGRAAQTGKRRWSEEDEAGRSQKDLFVISKEFKDPSVN